ncbi:MAG: hypothetical protein GC159_19965 [Phycisphaera sp.]|nr:hypothetical protein [Phycisphaera sp.]
MTERPEHPDHVELTELLARMVDGELTAAQRQRIEQLLADPAAQRHYARFVMAHAMLRAELRDHDSPIALQRGEGSADIEVELDADAASRTATGPMRIGPRGWHRQAIAAAVLIAAGVAVALLVDHSNIDTSTSPNAQAPVGPVATLTGAADAKWGGDAAGDTVVEPGADLDAGPLRLTSGSAQIVFRSGAAVNLVGPATFHLTGPNSGRLDAGRLRASVPHNAVGFTVDTPTHTVTDLGTRFGVRVIDDEHTEVHVFEGKVRVQPHIDPRPAASTTMHAGEALALTHDRRETRSIPVAEGRFDDTPMLFNTGVGAAPGEPDPHWWVRGPGFANRRAIVGGDGAFGDPNVSRVIAFASPSFAPNDVTHTFSTYFDVDRADADRVAIRGRFAVDNQITAIRVNGVAVDVPKHPLTQYLSFKPFAIPAGHLVTGQNVIEMDVFNAPGAPGKNGISVRVEMQLVPPTR